MKKSFLTMMTIAMALSFSSCGQIYYQVSTTKAVNPSLFASVKDGYVYEDENVIIEFDMWKRYGSNKCVVTNKTDKNIYVNLEKSCGINDNKVYTAGDDSRMALASDKYIIPAKKGREFNKFIITDSLYKAQNLKEKVRHSESISFDKEDSPFTFGSILTYEVENTTIEKTLQFEFYVSRLTNYSMKDFMEVKKVKVFSNGKWVKKHEYVPSMQPKNGYYIKYVKNGKFYEEWDK